MSAKHLPNSEIIRRFEKVRPGSTTGAYPVPTSKNLALWFETVERDARKCDIRHEQLQDIALLLLPETVRAAVMQSTHQRPCNLRVFRQGVVSALREIDELTERLEKVHSCSTAGFYPIPKYTNMTAWFLKFEGDVEEANIPLHRLTCAAYLVLPVRMRKTLLGRTGWGQVPWMDFKKLLGEIVFLDENPVPSGSSTDTYVKAATVAAGIGLVAAGGAILVPAAFIAGVNAVGFASAGVVGGSIAASFQSYFYGAATGGLFSIFQSFGATAVMPAAGSIASAVGSAVGGSALIGSALTGADTEDSDDDDGA